MAKPPVFLAKALVPEPETLKPYDAAEFVERGWLYFSRNEFVKAEADFLKAIEKDARNVDAFYALGLTYKGAGQPQKALSAFSDALNLLECLDDKVRAAMLNRLIKGHINQLSDGDWNLEKEVWRRVS